MQSPLIKKIPSSGVSNFKGSTSLGNRQEIGGLGQWEGQRGEEPGRMIGEEPADNSHPPSHSLLIQF